MSAEWPGNGILGLENSPSDFRAQVFRQGNGGNRANYFDLHVGDTMSKGRATVNVGLRYLDTDGSHIWCYHSERGHLRVPVWGPERDWLAHLTHGNVVLGTYDARKGEEVVTRRRARFALRTG